MEVQTVGLRSDGLELAGELYIPHGNKAFPALCICHGIPAVPHDPKNKGYAALARGFCDAGFLTLIFNFRGAGKSQGNLDLLGWSHDLQAAIEFLCALEQADENRLSLLGFSGGAAVAIHRAALDSRISAVAACACPADFGSLANEETGAGCIQHFRNIGVIRDNDFPPSVEMWLSGFQAVSPIHSVDKISPRPLLLVHGDADEVVPLEHAHRLYRKAREPKELLMVPGAKHRLRLEEQAMAAVLNWLKAKHQV